VRSRGEQQELRKEKRGVIYPRKLEKRGKGAWGGWVFHHCRRKEGREGLRL